MKRPIYGGVVMSGNDQTIKNIVPKIECIVFGGVDCGGDSGYFIVDETSHVRLTGKEFTSRDEAQAYLDAHREEILRSGLPMFNVREAELYGMEIEHVRQRLENGTIAAKEACELALKFAGMQNRCPDESFRQRLFVVLARLLACS